MKVPFNDLRRAALKEADDLAEAVQSVVESGWYIPGEHVRQFESEFAAYIGTAHAVSVANGTDALELALSAAQIGPGDRVMTCANAGVYASIAIRKTGAIPVYVDVDATSMTVSKASLDAVGGLGVRAFVLTHLYGQMADVSAAIDWSSARRIPLIEDCAQSHGARIPQGRAGSFGVAGCFSFYPTKNLGALGDGGAVVTSDASFADRLRTLRQYGWRAKYDVRMAGGMNSRLDEMQAAILRRRLRRLDAANDRRVAIARRYTEQIRHPSIEAPPTGAGDYVAHLYVIRTRARDMLREHLAARDVATDVHYPIPDHLQAAYQVDAGAPLPVTERLAHEVLSLPCFPELTDEEVAYVIEACNAWKPNA